MIPHQTLIDYSTSLTTAQAVSETLMDHHESALTLMNHPFAGLSTPAPHLHCGHMMRTLTVIDPTRAKQPPPVCHGSPLRQEWIHPLERVFCGVTQGHSQFDSPDPDPTPLLLLTGVAGLPLLRTERTENAMRLIACCPCF